MPLSFYEGVAPAALPLEGATRAPVIADYMREAERVFNK